MWQVEFNNWCLDILLDNFNHSYQKLNISRTICQLLWTILNKCSLKWLCPFEFESTSFLWLQACVWNTLVGSNATCICPGNKVYEVVDGHGICICPKGQLDDGIGTDICIPDNGRYSIMKFKFKGFLISLVECSIFFYLLNWIPIDFQL